MAYQDAYSIWQCGFRTAASNVTLPWIRSSSLGIAEVHSKHELWRNAED
jgi:hypothetical protein